MQKYKKTDGNYYICKNKSRKYEKNHYHPDSSVCLSIIDGC